jgi:hypothetical protein
MATVTIRLDTDLRFRSTPRPCGHPRPFRSKSLGSKTRTPVLGEWRSKDCMPGMRCRQGIGLRASDRVRLRRLRHGRGCGEQRRGRVIREPNHSSHWQRAQKSPSESVTKAKAAGGARTEVQRGCPVGNRAGQCRPSVVLMRIPGHSFGFGPLRRSRPHPTPQQWLRYRTAMTMP